MEIKEADEKITRLFEKYDTLETTTIGDVRISNNRLKDALSKQIELELKWQPLLSEVRVFKNRTKHFMETGYSDAMNQLLTNSYRKHSISEARELAKADPTYRGWKVLFVEADDLYEDVKGIVDVIHSRRYVLNNMTNSIIAGVKEDLL